VTVFSAAKAEEEAMRPSPKAAVESNLIMGFPSQEFSKSGANKSKAIAPATRIVARMRAALTIWLGSGRAQAPPSAQATIAAVNQPIAVAEAGKGRRDEIGLIGSERREISDPRAADAEAEQRQRRDATRRSRDCPENALGGNELSAGIGRGIIHE
jgi:hypothetical protein